MNRRLLKECVLMKYLSVFKSLATVTCLASIASIALGQNSVTVFAPVVVQPSAPGTGYGTSQVVFNSSTVSLSCTTLPITARLSSTTDGTGKLLADNFLRLTVTSLSPVRGSGGSTTNVNICSGGVVETTPGGPQNDCFNSAYQSAVAGGGLTGQNPDTFVANDGVAPIDISSRIPKGAVSLKFDLVDTGQFLSASTILLDTNCTQTGVTGPAKITGTPISSTDPTPPELTQDFTFNSTPDQVVQFVYDLSLAFSAGHLTITDQTTPNTNDNFINPALFIPTWVPGTSFATSSCLVHTGEVTALGVPACKLYTLQCQIGGGAAQSGAQCPVSTIRNEIFQENFDGPAFTLPDIINPDGPTFHQGIGFLEASEGWTGGSCLFDPASGLGALLCPQNLLTSFTGPGAYSSTGLGTHPNSSFITVAPVPEDLTTVTVSGEEPGLWINSQTISALFSSQPPFFSSSLPPVPGQAHFVAAPISSITYGISPADSVPPTGLPIPTDTTLTNTTPCPVAGGPPGAASIFTPPSQTIVFPSDGKFAIHYFAQDCAGTEELMFTQGAGGVWATNFYTASVNIDTVPPAIVSGPILSPAGSIVGGVIGVYALNQTVFATYECTDNFSGLVRCGASTFAPGSTLDSGSIVSPVDTSTPGLRTYTVTAIDSAGNQVSRSVPYLVASTPTP
jgi:hypothetical protein